MILLAYVREKGHEPGTLHREGEFALVLGTDAGVAGINNFCLTRNEAAQKIDFFIVDVL